MPKKSPAPDSSRHVLSPQQGARPPVYQACPSTMLGPLQREAASCQRGVPLSLGPCCAPKCPPQQSASILPQTVAPASTTAHPEATHSPSPWGGGCRAERGRGGRASWALSRTAAAHGASGKGRSRLSQQRRTRTGRELRTGKCPRTLRSRRPRSFSSGDPANPVSMTTGLPRPEHRAHGRALG